MSEITDNDKIGKELNQNHQGIMVKTSAFQQAIETVEQLSLEEQEILLSIIQKRLHQQRRHIISQEIKEVRQELAEGNIKFGSVDQFLEELDQP
jgi:phenylalanyl-tRNA synthetase alpha subunit